MILYHYGDNTLPEFYRASMRRLFGGLQLVSVGHFRTGQPFTADSL